MSEVTTPRCDICSTPIAAGKLMCLLHWRMVPADLQRAVNSTWRRFSVCKARPHVRIGLLRDYRTARDQAVQAVREQTTPADEPATTSLEST